MTEFLQPFLLAAAAFAAVPLLIHLFARRRAREVPFPALVFLMSDRKRQMSRMSLRQLLVLLCRMAAVISLAAAFALPVARRHVPLIGGARNTERIRVVLDNTIPMSQGSEGVTLLRRAGAIIGAMGDRSMRGDEIIVEPVCGDPLSFAGGNSAPLRDAMDAMPVADCGVTPGEKVADALERSGAARGAVRERLVVISGFHRSGYAGRLRVKNEKKAAATLINVSLKTAASNVIVDTLRPPLFPLAGEQLQVCYDYGVFGAVVERFGASLYMDGVKRGEHSVDARLKKKGADCFRFSVDRPGRHFGAVEVRGDTISGDNRHFFIIDAMDSVNIVMLTGRGSSDEVMSDEYFLWRALKSVSGAGPSERAFVIKKTAAGAFRAQGLGLPAVIVVPGAIELSGAMLGEIRSAMARGAGVLFVLPQSDDSRELLASTVFGKAVDIAPADAGGNSGVFQKTGHIDMTSMVFGGMEEVAKSVAEARFVSPGACRAKGGATVPMALEDGSPLISIVRTGAGGAMLLCSSLTPASTTLALKPAFVPMVTRSVQFLAAGGGTQTMSYRTGGRPAMRMSDTAASISAREMAIGTTAPVIMKRRGNESGTGFYTAGAVLMPGAYSATGEGNARGAFVVNVRPDKSDPAMMDKKGMNRFFKGVKLTMIDARDLAPTSVVAAMNSRQRETGLWFALLLAGLVFLLAEGLIANRIPGAKRHVER